MADGIRVPDKGALSSADSLLAVYNGTTGLLSTSALGTVLAAAGILAPVTVTDALGNRVTALEGTVIAGGSPTAGGPVEVVATSNVTRSGEQTIDGVTTSASRVLLVGQTAPAENGIWVTASGAWARATDMDEGAEVQGTYVYVAGGTVGRSKTYFTGSEVTTIGTDPITFTEARNGNFLLDELDAKLASDENLADLDDPDEARVNILAADLNAPIPTLNATGTGDVMTASAPAGMTGYANGQEFLVYPSGANTGADPTLDIGGFGPLPFKDEGGGDLVADDLSGGRPYLVRVSGAADQFNILTRGYNRPLVDGLAGKAAKFTPIVSVSSSGGTADAQTASAPSGYDAYIDGQVVLWLPNDTNTAADPTLDIGGLGPLAVRRADGTAVEPGEIVDGTFHEIRKSGSYWRILSAGLTLPQVREDLTEFSRDLDAAIPNFADWYRFEGATTEFTQIMGNYNVPAVSWDSDSQGDFVRVPREVIGSNYYSGGATILSSYSNGRFLIRQMDASGTEIRDLSDGNGDYREEQTFPADISDTEPYRMSVIGKVIADDCTEIRMYVQGFGAGGTNVVGFPWLTAKGRAERFSARTPALMSEGKMAYVSTSGNIANVGTIPTRAFPTMKQALASGASTIILRDGIYDAADMEIDGNLFGKVRIIAENDAKPIIRGGVEVTGFTAVSGRTNVYQAACTTEPYMNDVSDPAGFVFVQEEPWSAITLAERHPAHRGRSHRCPHYPLYAGPTDMDSLEAATEFSWWWSGDVLYVNAPTGVDALSMTVVVPQGTGYVNRHPWNQIEMQGLTFEFMGLVMNDCSRYLLEGVTVIGAPTDGLSLDYTCGVDRFCTVIGSSNDNWNIHGNVDGSTDATGRPSLDNFQVSEEMCSILAWDDGHSAHERSAVTLRAGS